MKKTSIQKLSLRKDVVARLGKGQLTNLAGGNGATDATYHCTDDCTGQHTRLCNSGPVKCVTDNLAAAISGGLCYTGPQLCYTVRHCD